MEKSFKKKEKKGFSKRIPSIIGIIVCVLLAPILIMNFTIIIKSYISPDKVPDFFGIKPFIVDSPSMTGTVNKYDIIITKNIDPAKLKKEDIISFKDNNGSVITHRIEGLTEIDGKPAFITKGDANNKTDDDLVFYSQVESVYINIRIPNLGRLAIFIQTPLGMLAFIGIPLCGFIIYDIIRRILADKKSKATDSEVRAELEKMKALLKEKEEQNSEMQE